MPELRESDRHEITDAYFNISNDASGEHLSMGSTNMSIDREDETTMSVGIVKEFYSGDDSHGLEGESCISVDFEQEHLEDDYPVADAICTSYLTKKDAAELMVLLYQTIKEYEEMDDG